LSAAVAADMLGANLERGLTAAEAVRRLARHGPNAIREAPARGPLRLFLDQFADFMILILIAAALLSGIIGDAKDTITIAVIVLLNAVVGFVQELRAARAVAALRQLAAPAGILLRDGRRQALPAAEIVPGDIVLLEAGGAVPADLRLFEAAELRLGEAPLTGESMPIDKTVGSVEDAVLPVADRKCMAFKGTTVLHGRGRGIVVATGMATELGRIATLLERTPQAQTPLQRRLAAFGRQLGLGALAICAIVFATGLLRGEPTLLMLLTALSLAVAAIPEALPAVVTVLLALGARRMAARRALVRRLPAVETLGSVTYICTDKTGTLTLNEMRVGEIRLACALDRPCLPADAAGPQAIRLFQAIALCNDAVEGEQLAAMGDPTEIALRTAAGESGLDLHALDAAHPRVMELPFDSERKRMTTVHASGGSFIAFAKGAPESILDGCAAMATEGGTRGLDRTSVQAAIQEMADNGLRVLAVAWRPWAALPAAADPMSLERELVLLGLVGLIDPPRPEALQAVAVCKAAGIVPVMITGDHPATARAIARRLGIIAEGDEVLTGRELSRLSGEALKDRVLKTRVYARVDPAQKISIVEALQASGQFVAMTGDGVNDAPALARADIGIAMGRSGTDVAREAASLVLLDDNFATIVAAVREGRRIFDNIRKFVRYAVTCNSAEIWTIFLAPFLGLPVPLLPIQILWINLVTDGLPGLALAAEPAERGVMGRSPRRPGESIFAHGMWQHMVWVGLAMAGLSLLTQAYAVHSGWAHWRTMVFTVLTLSQMSHVLAIRSERESLLTQGLLSNRPLLGAVVLTILLQMATIYVPALNAVFDTEPLSPAELTACFAIALLVLPLVEAEKWLIRRGLIYRANGIGSA
jgi:Ca2+-transporting ATPase